MTVNFLYLDNISVRFCQGCSFTCRNRRKHNKSAVCRKKRPLSERTSSFYSNFWAANYSGNTETNYLLSGRATERIHLSDCLWDLRLLFCTQTNRRCKHQYSEVNWCKECSPVSPPCTESFTALCWGATKDWRWMGGHTAALCPFKGPIYSPFHFLFVSLHHSYEEICIFLRNCSKVPVVATNAGLFCWFLIWAHVNASVLRPLHSPNLNQWSIHVHDTLRLYENSPQFGLFAPRGGFPQFFKPCDLPGVFIKESNGSFVRGDGSWKHLVA